jgi:hypothetical protein
MRDLKQYIYPFYILFANVYMVHMVAMCYTRM